MNQSFFIHKYEKSKNNKFKRLYRKKNTIKIYFIPIKYQSKSHFNFFKIKLNKK
jgi:hypothetical protein